MLVKLLQFSNTIFSQTSGFPSLQTLSSSFKCMYVILDCFSLCHFFSFPQLKTSQTLKLQFKEKVATAKIPYDEYE